jgi:truncated hemoglobin YjbI
MINSASLPGSRGKKAVGQETASLYERIGAEKVDRLVSVFYARVDSDPVIRPFYGKTLSCAIRGLTAFVTSWLGGPATYDLDRARLRRRHAPFAIDARARDAWLSHMKAAVRELGIPGPEARVLLAHLEFGARALVNTSATPKRLPCPVGNSRFDRRLAERWNRTVDAEDLLDAISRGDVALVRAMLPRRLVPHAVLMSHVFARSLDPEGRVDARYRRRSTQVNPRELLEILLANRDLDVDPAPGDELGRFCHLQAMIEAYAGASRIVGADEPLGAVLREATLGRFMSQVARDPSVVRLVGPRGQTLLHDAVMAGQVEFATALIRAGADPDAKEAEGHTPLYRAATGQAARVLLAAGATVDVPSGPTRGTALHQAARRGRDDVAAVLLDHGADMEARDNKGQTPLRRAVNCRKLAIVELLVCRGANPHARDNHGVTPVDVARTAEMKRALGGR